MSFEVIFGGLLLATLTGLLGLILGGKKKVNEDTFKDHVESDNPHHACPVHESQLSDIAKVLDRIDKRVYSLILGSKLSNLDE